MTTTVNQLLNAKPRQIFSVTPETMVIDAVKEMNEKKVGALPVIRDNKLVGILSERDYTRKVILNNKNSAETPVSEIMTENVKTVCPLNSSVLKPGRTRTLSACNGLPAVKSIMTDLSWKEVGT